MDTSTLNNTFATQLPSIAYAWYKAAAVMPSTSSWSTTPAAAAAASVASSTQSPLASLASMLDQVHPYPAQSNVTSSTTSSLLRSLMTRSLLYSQQAMAGPVTPLADVMALSSTANDYSREPMSAISENTPKAAAMVSTTVATMASASVTTPVDLFDNLDAYWLYLSINKGIFMAIVLVIIMIFTIVGNGMVIWAIFNYRPLHNVQNMFMVSLAVADIAVAVLVMPFNVAYNLMGRWVFGLHLCEMWLTSDVLCCTASILNLCAIALDRYWAIHDPINYAQKRTMRRVCVKIALVWIFSAIISIPPLIGWNDWPETFTDETPCKLSEEKFYLVYSSAGSFYIPLLIMTVVYYKIFQATRRRLKDRAKASAMSNLGKFTTATATVTAAGATTGTMMGNNNNNRAANIGDQQRQTMVQQQPNQQQHHHTLTKSSSNEDSTSSNSPRNTGDVGARATLGGVSLRERCARCCCWCGGGSSMIGNGIASGHHHHHHHHHHSHSQQQQQQQQHVNRYIKNESSSNSNTNNNGNSSSKNRFLRKSKNSSFREAQIEIESASDDIEPFRNEFSSDAYGLTCELHKELNSMSDLIVQTNLVQQQPPFQSIELDYQQDGMGATNSAADIRLDKPSEQINESLLTSTTMAATAEAEPTTTTRSRSDTRPISPAPSNDNNNNNSPPKPDDFPEDINDSSAPREYTPPTDVVTTIRQNNTFDIEYLQSRGPTLMPATNWSNSVAAPNTAQVSVKKIWEEKQKISLSRERRATRILGIVMGVFVACWLPFFLMYVIFPFCESCYISHEIENFIVWLGYINSALNPLIYCGFNRDFRRAFQKILLCKKV